MGALAALIALRQRTPTVVLVGDVILPVGDIVNYLIVMWLLYAVMMVYSYTNFPMSLRFYKWARVVLFFSFLITFLFGALAALGLISQTIRQLLQMIKQAVSFLPKHTQTVAEFGLQAAILVAVALVALKYLFPNRYQQLREIVSSSAA
jgi:hypothetical protein